MRLRGDSATPRQRRAQGGPLSRGYTIVELLMALSVFGIGVTGVFAMQKVTAVSNRHAKNLAVASHIAQSWLDHLAVDATRWTQRSGEDLTSTTWLHQSSVATPTWFQPADSVVDDFYAGFGAQGQPTQVAAEIVFCTHLRVLPLQSALNNGVVRTEVRVFWPRDGAPAGEYCDASSADVAAIGQDTENFHFVYKASAVRQSSY